MSDNQLKIPSFNEVMNKTSSNGKIPSFNDIMGDVAPVEKKSKVGGVSPTVSNSDGLVPLNGENNPFSYDKLQGQDPNQFVMANNRKPVERENFAKKYEENQAAAANTEKYPGTLKFDMAIENAEKGKGDIITLERSQTSLPHVAGISLGGNVNVDRKQYIAEQKKLRDQVLQQNSKLKSNANKALEDVKGNLERNIEYVTTNLNDFTETSAEGDKIPAKFKINEYAKKKALQAGVSDEGYYKNLLYNETVANVTHKIIEPKVIEKFNENYKKKYGKTPDEETSEEAIKGFTKDEEIIGKATVQVQSINDEISKIKNEEIEGLNNAVSQEAAAIKEQYQKAAPLVQNEEQAKSLHGEAVAAIDKLNQDFLKEQNLINSKYNARYRRQTAEIEKIANAKIAEESSKYKYTRSPDLRKRIEDEYKAAYSEVVKGNQAALEKRDYSYNPIINWTRTTVTALGGVVKGLSSAMEFDTGKVFGDYLSSSFQHGTTELKKFRDFLDVTKVSKSMGSLAGGMAPALIAAAGTTLATSGAGAPAALSMLAGGVASWTVETAGMAANMYEDKFAETGSVAKAENASKQTVDSQRDLMLFYAFDGLPFMTKSVKLAKNIPKRILLGGTIELGSNFLQEYPQNLFEEAIKADKPYMEGLELSSLERAKNTFLNIAPTFLLGGAGQATGVVSEKRQNSLAKAAAKSFALKSDINKIDPTMQGQYIFDMMQRKGKSFSTAYVGALYSGGIIDETQSKKLTDTIKLSEQTIENAGKYGLTPAQQKVYGAFALKRAEAMAAIEAEADPILKMAAEHNVRNIENDMVKFASGEQTDYTVVTLPNNEQYVMTQKEAEKAIDDIVFTESYANGDIKVQTYGKRSVVQEKLDEIDAENAKPKLEIIPEDVIKKAAEDGVFGELGKMVTSGQITPKQAMLELAMQKYGILGDGSESPTGGRDISMKTSLDVDEAVTKAFPTKESVIAALPAPSKDTTQASDFKVGDKIQWNVYGNEGNSEWTVKEYTTTRNGEKAVVLTQDKTQYQEGKGGVQHDVGKKTVEHTVPLSEFNKLQTQKDTTQEGVGSGVGGEVESLNEWYDLSKEHSSDTKEDKDAIAKSQELKKKADSLPDPYNFPEDSDERVSAISAIDNVNRERQGIEAGIMQRRLARLKETPFYQTTVDAVNNLTKRINELNKKGGDVIGDWTPKTGVTEAEFNKLKDAQAILRQFHRGDIPTPEKITNALAVEQSIKETTKAGSGGVVDVVIHNSGIKSADDFVNKINFNKKESVALDDIKPVDMAGAKFEKPEPKTLKRFSSGIKKPIVVDRKSMKIIDGNHRYYAAKEQGLKNIDVIFVDEKIPSNLKTAIAYNISETINKNDFTKPLEQSLPTQQGVGVEDVVQGDLKSGVDLKGDKKDVWMDNPIDKGKRVTELEQKNDKDDITDVEYDELKELRKGLKHTAASVLPTLDALSKKFNGIKNVSDAEQNASMVVWDAIKEGKYQKAIEEGRMTAQDAKTIIESAGLEVPKDILNQAQQQTTPTEQRTKESEADRVKRLTKGALPESISKENKPKARELRATHKALEKLLNCI